MHEKTKQWWEASTATSTCLTDDRGQSRAQSTFQHDWAKTESQGMELRRSFPRVYAQGRAEMWEIIQTGKRERNYERGCLYKKTT